MFCLRTEIPKLKCDGFFFKMCFLCSNILIDGLTSRHFLALVNGMISTLRVYLLNPTGLFAELFFLTNSYIINHGYGLVCRLLPYAA